MPCEPVYFQALNLIAAACSESGGVDWRTEWRNRTRKAPRPIPDDREMVKFFAVAIAYSQGARSSEIRKLVRDPVFEAAFLGFDPAKLARAKPDTILRRHWNRLGHMRFRGKVDRIVGCARVLDQLAREFGSFAAYLHNFAIPSRLRIPSDLDSFWQRFNRLQADLKKREMPFFRSTTSLLQLLLDLDYDSVKPDLIVMRLARRIGVVERETGDGQLRTATRRIQDYAVARGVRAQAVDLQMLAFGGQTGSRQMLGIRFCPSSDPCYKSDCPVGRNEFCHASVRS